MTGLKSCLHIPKAASLIQTLPSQALLYQTVGKFKGACFSEALCSQQTFLKTDVCWKFRILKKWSINTKIKLLGFFFFLETGRKKITFCLCFFLVLTEVLQRQEDALQECLLQKLSISSGIRADQLTEP